MMKPSLLKKKQKILRPRILSIKADMFFQLDSEVLQVYQNAFLSWSMTSIYSKRKLWGQLLRFCKTQAMRVTPWALQNARGQRHVLFCILIVRKNEIANMISYGCNLSSLLMFAIFEKKAECLRIFENEVKCSWIYRNKVEC